jgi:hypothetical protein
MSTESRALSELARRLQSGGSQSNGAAPRRGNGGTVNIGVKTAVTCGLISLLAACSHGSSRPAETASADAPLTSKSHPDSASAATDSIAEARCAREDRCTNIGNGKKYSSTQDCLTRVRDDWKDDLNARECPHGVNQTELDQCIDQVRNEECSNPLDTLSRMTQCTAGQICAK